LGSVRANFLRVVGVTPHPTAANTLVLELQNPPQSPPANPWTVVVVENVAEVYERGAN
jgi:hypothetical protein